MCQNYEGSLVRLGFVLSRNEYNSFMQGLDLIQDLASLLVLGYRDEKSLFIGSK